MQCYEMCDESDREMTKLSEDFENLIGIERLVDLNYCACDTCNENKTNIFCLFSSIK